MSGCAKVNKTDKQKVKVGGGMKKALVIIALIGLLTLTGCSESERVSQNLAKEADNFNVVRQLTVINGITDDIILQMTGKISVTADREDNQLEIIIEDENGNYKKDIVGLADNVIYNVEDLEVPDVSKYKYTLNFNPKMWVPTEVKAID